MAEEFHVIIIDYNGHYEGGGTFTTRQNEAGEIRKYLKEKGIDSVCMVYGQSMGTEIGMELTSQLIKSGVKVGCCFFDMIYVTSDDGTVIDNYKNIYDKECWK